jgi:hypothetical protein
VSDRTTMAELKQKLEETQEIRIVIHWNYYFLIVTFH